MKRKNVRLYHEQNFNDTPMNALDQFEKFYFTVKCNRWYWVFSIFCRLSLAYAFFAAGMVKILGERFASGLSAKVPMGAYLEALHHTGFYYTFIGITQVVAAILLLIPRTVLLGALLYFPIILNICILSFAIRFEGSLVTAPLMVLANLFLLVWNYDRLKFILPFRKFTNFSLFEKPQKYSKQFPYIFFLVVMSATILTIAITEFSYDTMPRNSLEDCEQQFKNTKNETAGCNFCDCIHNEGRPLEECLKDLEKVTK